MVNLLVRLWTLPWPGRARTWLRRIGTSHLLQRLLFPTFLVGVVGVIENDRGEILLLRHTYRERHPWGLPSGWIERGEQPADALRRELREEAGFDVSLGPVWSVSADPRVAAISIVFRGRYTGGAFTSSAEVSSAQFFPPDSLPDILEDQRALIEASRTEEVPH